MTAPVYNANMMNPYAYGLADFANAYASTDPMEYYGNQRGLPFGGYGQFGDMYGMFGMMGYDPRQLYTPLNHASIESGRNPYDGLYFRNNPDAQRAAMATSTAIQTGLASLHSAVVSDNQDAFYTTYGNLCSAVKNDLITRQGYNPNDPNLDAVVKNTVNLQYQSQAGMTLEQALEAQGDSSFLQGCKDVLSLGILSDKRTVQENINLVANRGANDNALRLENRKQNAGRIITGTTAACLAAAAVPKLCTAAAAIPGFGWIIAGVGLVAGLGIAFFGSK